VGKPSVAAFCSWIVVGACAFVALLTPFTVGWVAALAATAGTVALLSRPEGRTGAAFGALTGAGALPLYVAWLNRDGPGTVCTTTATSSHCVDEWSPWAWLSVGVLLIAVGAGAFVLARRSTRRSSPPSGWKAP
jgi:hypothetical protein